MRDAIFTLEHLAPFHDDRAKRRKRLACRLQNQRVVHARMIPLVGCTAERDVNPRMFDLERTLAEIDVPCNGLMSAYGLCTCCGRAIRASPVKGGSGQTFVSELCV
jgi:hypothetical protein